MEEVLSTIIIVILGTAGLLTLVRIVRGPSVLDRAIGLEVMVTILVCALGAEAALTRHTTTLPILVSLSLLGFVGSVAVVRFVPTDMDPHGDDSPGIPDAVLAEEGRANDGGPEGTASELGISASLRRRTRGVGR